MLFRPVGVGHVDTLSLPSLPLLSFLSYLLPFNLPALHSLPLPVPRGGLGTFGEHRELPQRVGRSREPPGRQTVSDVFCAKNRSL